MNLMTPTPSIVAYNRFIEFGLLESTPEKPNNVRYDFKKMLHIFEDSYVYWLEVQYKLLDNYEGDREKNLEELCKVNGNVPKEFFDRFMSKKTEKKKILKSKNVQVVCINCDLELSECKCGPKKVAEANFSNNSKAWSGCYGDYCD